MSKTPQAAPREEASAAATLTLTEFCVRLSEKVRRPELISAFEHHERVSGKPKDTAEAFQARFDKFINKPV